MMTIAEFARLIDSEGRPPATETALAEFEALLGQTLPTPYRQFLALTGGGLLRNGCRFGNSEVRLMLALTDHPRFSLERNHRDPGWYPIPFHLLEIGNDTGGNPLAISLRDDRFGAVFLIDHELVSYDAAARETIEEAEEYGLATPCAASFTELLANAVRIG